MRLPLATLLAVLLSTPAAAHEVLVLATGAGQTEIGISDNRVVMYETDYSTSPRQTLLHDFLDDSIRAVAWTGRDSRMNLQGDVAFAGGKAYRYATDELLDVPGGYAYSRPQINLAGDVVFRATAQPPSAPASDVHLWEIPTGTVINMSSSAVIYEPWVVVSDNGDAAWSGSSAGESHIYVWSRATGLASIVSTDGQYSKTPEDMNAGGDVIWTEYHGCCPTTGGLFLYDAASGAVQQLASTYVGHARISDNGDVVWLSSWPRDIWLYDRSDDEVRQITFDGLQWEPEINASGDFTWYGGIPGWDIFFYDGETQEIEQLTFDGAIHYYPQINNHGDVAWIQHDWVVDARIHLARNAAPVAVEVGPGQGCIQHDGNGVFPVTIFGSDEVDVRDIDAATVRVGSMLVKTLGNGTPLVAYVDANGDQVEDLVAQIEDGVGVLAAGTPSATVLAELGDGTLVSGSDTVCVNIPGQDPIVWAVSATASSEWSATQWSAAQATGAPDVSICADAPSAWAPLSSGPDPEWIELDFGAEYKALGLQVHETYESGFLTQVDLIDQAGAITTIWAGADTTPCPGWFELDWGHPSIDVRWVRLYTQTDGWEEVDAVGLVVGN